MPDHAETAVNAEATDSTERAENAESGANEERASDGGKYTGSAENAVTSRAAAHHAEDAWYGENAGDVLVVKGLRRSYGAVRAVDDVSFTLPHGGSLGIVGESGSGKTTTARIVVGLERADEGEVHVRGRSRTVRRRGRAQRLARAREVQMVFQDPLQSLDPRTSVEAALLETLRLHFPERDHDRRVRELLDQVGLGTRAADALPLRSRAASGSAWPSPGPSPWKPGRPRPGRGRRRARRVRAGTDPQPARRHPGADLDRLPLHHP